MQAFTVSAAARLCGVDRRTLQRAIQAGRLPLDTQHCLSRESLIAAGYLDAMTPQSTPQGTPLDTPRDMPQLTPLGTSQGMPQSTPQELVQATALLALLERLTTAITGLHEEVRSLRDDLRHLSRITPQDTPQLTPQGTPQLSPQILGLYDPRAAAVRIRVLRRQGLSYAMIALQLTQEGIPTRYGKPWEHSSVRYVLETYGQESAE
jgi:Recombinase